jgi:hypothetical protein
LALSMAHPGDGTALGKALARWPRRPLPDAGFAEVDRLVRDLARAGHLTPVGEGWHAGYVPTARWIKSHRKLRAALAPVDRAALRRAGQALRASLSTWSKNFVAADPSGLSTTTSSTNRRQAASR